MRIRKAVSVGALVHTAGMEPKEPRFSIIAESEYTGRTLAHESGIANFVSWYAFHHLSKPALSRSRSARMVR
jgi:hypothetical protein